MQNATDLARHPYVAPSEKENTDFENLEAAGDAYVAQMTTIYLQANQTDFHILPSCNATKCTASGAFINDDGVTLDLTQRNTYAFTYEHDALGAGVSPVSMTVTIKTTGLKAMINANDLLNKIEIYDATAFGMDLATGATYSVAVNFVDTKKTAQSLGDAKWSD